MLKHHKRAAVAFSLSEEEHRQIRQNAKRLGYRSSSEYVRARTLNIKEDEQAKEPVPNL
jgi:Arc/MetJ-type ribon-helix-helix transcriptional regulator